jgi:peptidoglycan/xylan/chitin deacetylase (PgdA/CDA1 family)
MWRRLVTAVAFAIVLAGLTTGQITSAQAATYYKSRCGNTSGRVLLTFDDWAYGDPYRATRVGAYLKSRNIRAAFFLINKEAQKYPSIVSTLRQQGHWVLNHRPVNTRPQSMLRQRRAGDSTLQDRQLSRRLG